MYSQRMGKNINNAYLLTAAAIAEQVIIIGPRTVFHEDRIIECGKKC